MRLIITVLILLFSTPLLYSQAGNGMNQSVKESKVIFLPHPDQEYGFDQPGIGKPDKFYEVLTSFKSDKYLVPFKSVGQNKRDLVYANLKHVRNFDVTRLDFRINNNEGLVSFSVWNDTLMELQLPSRKENYSIYAYYKNKLAGKLNVEVYKPIREKIRLVSLIDKDIENEYLQEFLNEIYLQANIRFSVKDVSFFKDTLYNDKFIFNNPSSKNDRLTNEMRDLRDRYFEQNPDAPKDEYYLFIIPGFVDQRIDGYMVRNHALGFIKWQNEPDMFHAIGRELGHGVGMLKHFWLETGIEEGSTLNLMDRNGGAEMMQFQWRQMRHSSNSYSYYDGDEDVKTNNGLVAYYFWEEDKDGFIEFENGYPLSKIERPFKKNYLSYHLNINDELFKVIYEWQGFFLCIWHLIILGLIILTWIIVRTVLFFRRRKNPLKTGYFKKKLVNISLNVGLISFGIMSFYVIDFMLKNHEVKSGLIADFHRKSINHVKKNILYNNSLRYHEQTSPRSEIMVKKKHDWYMKRRKEVLYFDVYLDEKGEYTKCKFRRDSDSLVLFTMNYRIDAPSHYTVFSYKNENGSVKYQKVYNHIGNDVTEKLRVQDAAKRILLFVNGYRPTSVGHSFEDNFNDIKSNGLEYPNSTNLIYSFDRFNYWRPWQEIDLKFQKKINAAEIYYADGHFSVGTSNHESLLNFTSLSTMYPKRCKNLKKHHCYQTTKNSTGIFGEKKVDTYSLLPTKPNKRGFRERYDHGKVAAKNLLMTLNEFPNRSYDDTLYIVAHSMGYAYSLGMIDELRGKIHFGGFYIIAPENASLGKVNISEWQEVWQYGSEFNKKAKDAPCLQDGVAPQACVGGLNENYRVYIPHRFDYRKGFFNSHFVGYYTWIFNIPEGRKGAIKQR